MLNPGINSNGINLFIIAILLLLFALIYPLCLSKIHIKIKRWNVYSLFILMLLIANGILVAFKLTLMTNLCLAGTLLFILGYLFLLMTRRNNLHNHILLVESYMAFLIVNIIVYYLV
ncbi:MAG: hypothetical protein DRO40_05110 [Thermoprotei archaeon]|nr:MAG: hypothetical protein DRO40_05110 [Thermoprotei archaeon]